MISIFSVLVMNITSERNVEIDRIYSWVHAKKIIDEYWKNKNNNCILFTPNFPRELLMIMNENHISEANGTNFPGAIIANRRKLSPDITYISKKQKQRTLVLCARQEKYSVMNDGRLFCMYYTFINPYRNNYIHVWGSSLSYSSS